MKAKIKLDYHKCILLVKCHGQIREEGEGCGTVSLLRFHLKEKQPTQKLVPRKQPNKNKLWIIN